MKVIVATLVLLVASASAMKRPVAANEDVVELFKRAAAPLAGLRFKRDISEEDTEELAGELAGTLLADFFLKEDTDTCKAAEQTYDACLEQNFQLAQMDLKKQLQSGVNVTADVRIKAFCNWFNMMWYCLDARLTACYGNLSDGTFHALMKIALKGAIDAVDEDQDQGLNFDKCPIIRYFKYDLSEARTSVP